MVGPGEVHLALTQQWPQDLQGLLEAVHAMIERQPERLVLGLTFTGRNGPYWSRGRYRLPLTRGANVLQY